MVGVVGVVKVVRIEGLSECWGLFFSLSLFSLPSPPNLVNHIRPAAPFMHDIRQVGMFSLFNCGADVRSYLLTCCAATIVKPDEA